MKVKELLKTKENWTKNVYARTEEGKKVSPGSQQAVCWCLMGAIKKCYKSPKQQDKISTLLEEELYEMTDDIVGIVEWNDQPERKWGEVKRLINKLDI